VRQCLNMERCSETGVLKNVGGLPHQWLPVKASFVLNYVIKDSGLRCFVYPPNRIPWGTVVIFNLTIMGLSTAPTEDSRLLSAGNFPAKEKWLHTMFQLKLLNPVPAIMMQQYARMFLTRGKN